MIATPSPVETVRAIAREAAADLAAPEQPQPAPSTVTLRGARVEVSTPGGSYTLAGPALTVPLEALAPLAGLALIVAAAIALLTLRR